MSKKDKKSASDHILTASGKKFKVPKEGSLGLLTLGYKGVMAWRDVRDQKAEKKDA